MNMPMKEELEKAFAKLFPDYEAGQEYAFHMMNYLLQILSVMKKLER